MVALTGIDGAESQFSSVQLSPSDGKCVRLDVAGGRRLATEASRCHSVVTGWGISAPRSRAALPAFPCLHAVKKKRYSAITMAEHFHLEILDQTDGVVTTEIGFGTPAANTEIVPEAIAALAELKLLGGRGIRFNGPASLPVAMALAHGVAHLFGYVACYDPKLSGYVVAISHDPAVRPGQLLI